MTTKTYRTKLIPPEGKTFTVDIEAESTTLAFTYIRHYYPNHHVLRLDEVVEIHCPLLGWQQILA